MCIVGLHGPYDALGRGTSKMPGWKIAQHVQGQIGCFVQPTCSKLSNSLDDYVGTHVWLEMAIDAVLPQRTCQHLITYT